MPAIGPYSPDTIHRVINVRWGGGVIVVFVDYNNFEKQSEFIPADGVEFLEEFPVSFVNPQPSHDATGRAYKLVPTFGDGNEFMETVAPSVPDVFGAFHSYFVHVFAINDDTTTSLEDAKSGVDLISSAWSFQQFKKTGDEPTVPADISPPGVLWSINTPAITGGNAITWKIRYGPHRAGDETDPPNDMVQVYPTTAPFNGYFIEVYRLDQEGADTAYGTLYPHTFQDDPPANRRIDPLWNQNLGNDTKGIPKQDPPPLIDADVS